jgi:hypothetical protein
MAFDEMIIGRIFEQFPLLVQFLILYIFIYYLKLLRESELFDFKRLWFKSRIYLEDKDELVRTM